MKKRIQRVMLYLLILLCLYVLVVVAVNRWIPPAAVKTCVPSPKILSASSSVEQLKVVTWNLGYAGLGADANFVADGGEDLRYSNRELVKENAVAIAEQVNLLDADIVFLQEVAGSSFINRNVDLKGMVLDAATKLSSVYFADVQSWLVPYPLNMDTGKMTLTKLSSQTAEGILLPLEETYYAGLLLREYRMAVSRLDIGREKQLVAINIHLAAFDDGSTRQKQVAAVLKFAQQEFEKGNYVLIGGDWNLRLSATNFPHSTKEEFLFWIADFPTEQIPDGWQMVADSRTPSVRTLHQAYLAGDNYVCTVDGFLLSPNLRSLEIENLDLGFRHSDHQPAVMTLQLLDGTSDD